MHKRKIFLLTLFVIAQTVVSYAQSIYHKNGSPVFIHDENLEYASDTVCIPSGFRFTVDSKGDVFYTVEDLVDSDGDVIGYRVMKYIKATESLETFLELDYSDDACGDLIGGIDGFSLIGDDHLMIFGVRKIMLIDLVSGEYTFINQPTFNGQFVSVRYCFECMGEIFCPSLEGLGTQRIWNYDPDEMMFYNPEIINLGLGLYVDYGCVGRTREFARLVTKPRSLTPTKIIRVYPWDGPFFSIVRAEYTEEMSQCTSTFGFEVKNHHFQLLAKNNLGEAEERQVFIDHPLCDSRNILLAELDVDLINEVGKIDSLSIHLSSAPADSYVRFDAQNITTRGNMTDSIVIYNSDRLSDVEFVELVRSGDIRIENVPQTDSLSIELRAYNFLNVDGKTINITLTGEPPCDDWSTSTEDSEDRNFLFPNPFSDRIFLSESFLGYKYSLYDIAGVSMESGTIEKTSLDLRYLGAGTYFLRVTKKDNSTTIYRVVKI